MNCGTVLLDRNFQFPSGNTGEKLLIVVCQFGLAHLVLTTTSQQHSRSAKHGCQAGDRFPNFYLSGGSCWFSKPTWVQLEDVMELDANITTAKLQDRTMVAHREVLNDFLMKQIIECALRSEFIDEFYLDELRQQHSRL